MMTQKPLILVTNDDGFFSKGIAALVNGVKSFADVIVVAPNGPRSGMSNAISAMDPLRIYLHSKEENVTIYVCTGTPVDCVKLALDQVLDRKPDLVVTGINHGSNSAASVLYSGTMGAAMEGCLSSIPSIGFSLLDHASDADFSAAEKIVTVISKQVLKEGLPEGTCLNVNIPQTKDIAGIKIARQAKGKWVEEIQASEDGANRPVYWLTGYFENYEPEAKDTDEAVLSDNYVSVVPIKVDMTDYAYLDKLKAWEKLI